MCNHNDYRNSAGIREKCASKIFGEFYKEKILCRLDTGCQNQVASSLPSIICPVQDLNASLLPINPLFFTIYPLDSLDKAFTD